VAFQDIDISAELTGDMLRERREAVLRMLYVMFTEGYFASSGTTVLKLELCQEAIRLTALVAEHPQLSSSETLALLALMHLHHARREARADADNKPVPLENQDRFRYRRDELLLGLTLLDRASETGATRSLHSSYHLQAAIAAEHAFAPTFAETRWPVIVQLYDALEKHEPSALHTLHAAVAASYAVGPEAGLARLATMRPPTWLAGSHLWLATHADLNARAGRRDIARELYEEAVALAPALERDILKRRMATRLEEKG
jgi:predicted RNA polymerase sigma factor